MSQKTKLFAPDKPFAIEYPIWDVDPLPILTAEDIGKTVLWSGDTTKKFILIEVKSVGAKSFPEGGYIIKESGSDYPKSVEYTECILMPPPKKPKRAITQATLRKKRKPKEEKGASTVAPKTKKTPVASKKVESTVFKQKPPKKEKACKPTSRVKKPKKK